MKRNSVFLQRTVSELVSSGHNLHALASAFFLVSRPRRISESGRFRSSNSVKEEDAFLP